MRLTVPIILFLVTQYLPSTAAAESDFWEEAATPGITRYRELVNRGRELINEGSYEEALAQLEQARTRLPDESRAYRWSAHCFSRLGRHEEAANAWRRALELDESVIDDEQVALECVVAFASVGRFDEAADVLAQVLARGVSPLYHASVLLYTGDMLVAGSCDGLAEAIELYQEVVRDYPHHAAVRWRLAASLFRAGRHDEASIEIAAALRIDPQWESLSQSGTFVFPTQDVHLFKAIGWEQLGHTEQAQREWQAYLDAGGAAGCWAELARQRMGELGRRGATRRR